MVIVWSIPAREDLHLIHRYIAHDSKHYASRVVQDIVEKAEALRELPKLGRMVPEIGMYSYRIMYELIGETIYIHGVFHQRRNFKAEDLHR